MAILAIASLATGAFGVSVKEIIYALLSPFVSIPDLSDSAKSVVLNVRLPRIVLALACGAGLAAAGAAFQAIFSNPLATADTLGVSSGAAFGAVLGIWIGLPAELTQVASLVAGLIAVLAVWKISVVAGRTSVLMLILSGLVTASLFSALIGLVKFAADPQDELPAITFWLLGSLTGADWETVLLGLPFIVIGSGFIWAVRWKLNALSLSEDEAKSLGIPVAKLRLAVIAAGTLVTASVVSMCGLIGWVGLLIPHFIRLAAGSDNRTVVSAGLVYGAVFMLACDTVARSAAQVEIPVSVLTALFGAPVFLLLLKKGALKGV